MKRLIVFSFLLIGSLVANEFIVPKQNGSSIAQYRQQCIEGFVQLLQQFAQFDQQKGKLQQAIISLTGIVGPTNDLFAKAKRSTYQDCHERLKKIEFHVQKAQEEIAQLQKIVENSK